MRFLEVLCSIHRSGIFFCFLSLFFCLEIKLIGAVVVWKIPVNLSSLLRRELCTGWTNSAIQVTRNCISIHQLWSGQGDGMTVGANGGVLYNGRSQFVKDGIVRDRR